MIPEDFYMPYGDAHNLDFGEVEEGAQSVNMMRIGRHLINKDDISYIDLGDKVLGVRIYFRAGHFIEYDGEEVEIIRSWLLEKFPCERDQILYG